MRRRVSKNGRKHQQQKVTQNNTLSKVGDTTSLHCKRCDISLTFSLSLLPQRTFYENTYGL